MEAAINVLCFLFRSRWKNELKQQQQQYVLHQKAEFDHLFELAEMDIMALVEKAKSLGLFSPLFPPKEKKAS